jgi:hypothetical protein
VIDSPRAYADGYRGLLILLVAACGGASSEPGPDPALVAGTGTCDVAGTRMVDVLARDLVAPAPPAKHGLWKARLAEAITASCREARWPQSFLDCADAARDRAALERCRLPLTAENRRALRTRLEATYAALADDLIEDPPDTVPMGPSNPAGAARTSGPTTMAACDAYLIVLRSYVACEKLPALAATALRKELALTEAGTAEMGSPKHSPAARQAMADICLESTIGMVEPAAKLGCTLATPPPPALVTRPAAAPR